MKDLKIIVGYKEDGVILEHFRKNWKTIWPEKEDAGVMFNNNDFTGIHPKVSAISVQEIKTSKNEYINVIDEKGTTPLFQLQGPKALQLKVLEDFLKGHIKNLTGVKWL